MRKNIIWVPEKEHIKVKVINAETEIESGAMAFYSSYPFLYNILLSYLLVNSVMNSIKLYIQTLL